MPTWSELAWAAFLFGYGTTNGDPKYQSIMGWSFLNTLGINLLNPQQIQYQIIKEFLNDWGRCHIHNNPQSAQAILTTLQNLVPYLQALNAFDIRAVNFAQNIIVSGNHLTVSQAVEQCYTSLRNIGYNFGPAATSKLLHILQPSLLIMWDNPILSRYQSINPRVTDSGQGYCIYLQMMQQAATQIYQSFPCALNPPDPATYLSTQMGYTPPKTLAKYIDEYNWITITHGVQVPPSWHP